jgi:plasmid stabilization system protein ParE
LLVEHHVIYYDQPDDSTIVVRRILHQRQDAGAAVIDPRS